MALMKNWVGEGTAEALLVDIMGCEEEGVDVGGSEEVVGDTVEKETGPAAATTPVHRVPVK